MAPLCGETENYTSTGFFINFLVLSEFSWHPPDPSPGPLEHRAFDGAGPQDWLANTEGTSNNCARKGSKQGSRNGTAETDPLYWEKQ